MAMENQLVYKLASLESTISNSLRRIDEKIDRMQTDMHARHMESAQEMSRFASSVENRLTLKRARMDGFEKDLHDFKNTLALATLKAKDDAQTLVNIKFNDLNSRLDGVEDWQTKMTVRGSMALGGVVIAWTLFGKAFQDWLTVAF
jgi:hypothetical protein